jgi:hypothetical protein
VNCSDVQARLSAYHDSELSNEEAAQVAAHLAQCPLCAAELATFAQLSRLSGKLTDPPVPTGMWEELQAKIHEGRGRGPLFVRFNPISSSGGLVALAATILIAAAIGVIAYSALFPAHDQLAANFATFLNDFSDSPDRAQQMLLASYDGRPISLEEATTVLGYPPVVAKGLPQGYKLEKTYLLKMPCCTCTEIVCRTKQGNSIAIFEHSSDQPVWFGNRAAIKCQCDNVPTSVVQFGDRLAASWKNGNRHITIIGANDLDDVTAFVAHFNEMAARDG